MNNLKLSLKVHFQVSLWAHSLGSTSNEIPCSFRKKTAVILVIVVVNRQTIYNLKRLKVKQRFPFKQIVVNEFSLKKRSYFQEIYDLNNSNLMNP